MLSTAEPLDIDNSQGHSMSGEKEKIHTHTKNKKQTDKKKSLKPK